VGEVDFKLDVSTRGVKGRKQANRTAAKKFVVI